MRFNQKGESLVSVLVAATVGGMVMLSLSGFTSTMFRSAKHTELTGELSQLRSLIAEQIDCEKTFAEAGIDPNDPSACNTTSANGGQTGAGKFLRLVRKTKNGSVQFLTTALEAGGGKLGSYTLRATCSASEQTIVIRAARPAGNGFAEDPLTKKPASWDDSKALLFGTAPSLPICYAGASTGAKRQATVVVGISIFNTGLEFVDVDLTGSAPVVTGVGYLHSFEWTEPFQKSGKILASAGYRYVDVRVGYSNVTATPVLKVSYPSPGHVRISLGAMSDIEAAGGSNPAKGSAAVELSLTQF